MDKFLNSLFFVFHTVFILFVLFGWMLRKARRIHLAALVFTAFSWFVLGIFYGFGYCFCTDWHWTVRYRLGYIDMPRSYINLLILAITGQELNDMLVDVVTMTVFIGVFILAAYLAMVKRKDNGSG